MPVKKESRNQGIKGSKVKLTISSSRAKRGDLPRNEKLAASVATLLPPARDTSLSVPAYSLAGRKTRTLALPKEIFGQKVNKQLLAQAIRVYSTNQKHLTGSTKTRGEVEGSTVKIYRQKGTGRARHGAIRAPIFVGGGIVFGPKPRQVRLNLPQKMKKAALISALSAKLADKNIIGLTGIEKASGKTKEMVVLIKKQIANSVLIVTGEKQEMVARAVRNIPGVTILPANLLNAYEVLKHELLLITKEAVEKIGNQSVIARNPD